MNKAHRDRIAFMRICSGKFDANMEVRHVQGNKVDIPVPAPADYGGGDIIEKNTVRKSFCRRQIEENSSSMRSLAIQDFQEFNTEVRVSRIQNIMWSQRTTTEYLCPSKKYVHLEYQYDPSQ